ncbi:radical SAM protein [Burkholderia sp. RS02]|uniref:radical SAM protein n=1 Tax=unclassified Burkholderia TaxID=2613784 RepID=UPI003218B6BA
MRHVSQLTVLTANQCTAACGHCSMNSSPQRRERLSYPAIRKVVDDLLDARGLGMVIFAGGEPTLLKQHLLDAIAFCSAAGVKTRLVTNASWAITRGAAERTIDSLREAGLDEINYSADDYHLPFIPFRHVVNAWHASKGKGFDSVVIANCYGPNSTLTSDSIQEQLGETLAVYWDEDGTHAPLPEPGTDGTRYLISNARLQRLGRGRTIDDAELIFPANQALLNLPCPWAVTSAALSAQGHLLACCGTEAHANEFLDFGDALTEHAGTLVERTRGNLVVQAIGRFGPLFLMNFVKLLTDEPLFAERYSSVCEVCEAVVHHPRARELLNAHLHELAPLLG